MNSWLSVPPMLANENTLINQKTIMAMIQALPIRRPKTTRTIPKIIASIGIPTVKRTLIMAIIVITSWLGKKLVRIGIEKAKPAIIPSHTIAKTKMKKMAAAIRIQRSTLPILGNCSRTACQLSSQVSSIAANRCEVPWSSPSLWCGLFFYRLVLLPARSFSLINAQSLP